MLRFDIDIFLFGQLILSNKSFPPELSKNTQ
jgi:hypothetical protein